MSFSNDPPPAYTPTGTASYNARFHNAMSVLNSLNPEALMTAQEAMVKKASLPETQAALVQQVRELGESAMRIDGYFDSAKNSFTLRVDTDEHLRQKCAGFSSRWIELQKRWQSLLWDSRDIAGKAETYIKDFTDVIIPMIGEIKDADDVEECQDELVAFVQRPERGKQPGKYIKLSDTFGKLKDDVDVFRDEFSECSVTSELIDIRKQLELVRSEVKLMEDMLKRKRKSKESEFGPFFKGLTSVAQPPDLIRMESTRSPTLTDIPENTPSNRGVMGCLYSLAPYTAMGIMGAGISAVTGTIGGVTSQFLGPEEVIPSFKSTQEVGPNQRRLLQQEKRIVKQAQILADLKELIDFQTSLMSGVCNRLAGLHSLWDAVGHDANMINDQLNNYLGSSSWSQKAFKRRIEVIRVSNYNLGKALNQYAVTFRR